MWTERRRAILLAVLTVALAGAPASAGAATSPPASAAAVKCPTFLVQHNDTIGRLKLPRGNYNVTVSGISCTTSTSLFAAFLEDYDGVLPRPFSYTVQGVGRGSFLRSGRVIFTVSKAGGGGGGGGGDGLCANTYSLGHNDRIGSLALKKGRYDVYLLSPRLTCNQAAKLLTSFLEDFDGNLSGGWTLLAETATFVRGSVNYGFRIKPTGGKPGPGPDDKQFRCPLTFRVQHNDRIGPLRFPAGSYYIDVVRLSCAKATGYFRQFLLSPSGRLPSPWSINAQTGTFVKRGSPSSFQAKPAFNDSRSR